ncbi:5'-3' exonuclease, putative [Plasmodium knowlesi strain H]|uniref:5'-3' exonuclease, putative n=3 Tax=Plasmodium knowlesi TaxID=5850 RepID=A0A5K1V5Y5_PLAKH|nr:5'-3' exonuclease, putative [Plasmodium knowlesi strain H]OTN66704.1 putative 5'-3' exonuclease [Plasmodium knowlesi]CAA9986803.1 5'-3' exonuclease, putative [Plasmodium knowlesi strain H]SBO23651.1 5'-3' exonuclease, putative [Plasmodium knowlesi strain H]SBO25221.1 5'-3' exonuclease, putative [Plasmodium knowlesi strain H]VVS76277.1 5'-3' exonuclease, putative [Plasmodium knowlesi strain H]|eukprot:XP_002257987.1 5'-3' exonuclease, putative [Plasmodium knowlesi strain H]
MPKHLLVKGAVYLAALAWLSSAGIPGLHKWVIQNFPSCVKVVEKNNLLDVTHLTRRNFGNGKDHKKGGNDWKKGPTKIGHVDNLLFDMNQLLHKANVQFVNDEQYFCKLSYLIRNVLRKFPPQKNIVFAIDGICPFSKLKLQIKRRAKGKKLQDGDNSNDITCGSPFIQRVAIFLQKFVTFLVSLPKYKHIKVYVSTDREVGEGELKLMNWIQNYVRGNSSQNEESSIHVGTRKAADESFVIVGADADLLLQCLALKDIRNVCVYTYQTFLVDVGAWEKKKKEDYLSGLNRPNGEADNIGASIPKWKKKKIKVLYNLNTFTNLFWKKYPSAIDQIRRDMLILFILKGNDYLPKIREGNFSTFFQAYFNMLDREVQLEETGVSSYGGLLTEEYTLNKPQFVRYLNQVHKLVSLPRYYLQRFKDLTDQGDKIKGTEIDEEGRGFFKEHMSYLPLSLLNELISKRKINKNDLHIEVQKEEGSDLFRCTMTQCYMDGRTSTYSGSSRRKKVAMHLASHDYLENEFPSCMRFVDSGLLRKIVQGGEQGGATQDGNLEEERGSSPERENGTIQGKAELSDEPSGKEQLRNPPVKEEHSETQIHLKTFYVQNCGGEANFQEEMNSCENYLQGVHWLVQMYTQTCCLNFNFFYKYTTSPSLLSLYYFLSGGDSETKHTVMENTNRANVETNILQNINLNVFRNNQEYHKFINFCVGRYTRGVMKEKQGEKEEEPPDHVPQKAYFENIYDILFCRNANVLMSQIQKLNQQLKGNLHRRKQIVKYYWDVYASRLKKCCKVIFYRGKKIYLAKFPLFRIASQNEDFHNGIGADGGETPSRGFNIDSRMGETRINNCNDKAEDRSFLYDGMKHVSRTQKRGFCTKAMSEHPAELDSCVRGNPRKVKRVIHVKQARRTNVVFR